MIWNSYEFCWAVASWLSFTLVSVSATVPYTFWSFVSLPAPANYPANCCGSCQLRQLLRPTDTPVTMKWPGPGPGAGLTAIMALCAQPLFTCNDVYLHLFLRTLIQTRLVFCLNGVCLQFTYELMLSLLYYSRYKHKLNFSNFCSWLKTIRFRVTPTRCHWIVCKSQSNILL